MRKSIAMKIAARRRKPKPLPPIPEPTPEEMQTNAWLDAIDAEDMPLSQPGDTVSIIPAGGGEPRMTRPASEGMEWLKDECRPGETISIDNSGSSAAHQAKNIRDRLHADMVAVRGKL